MRYIKYIFTFIVIVALYNCASPKNFTCCYEHIYTGLDTTIRTDGYYVSQRECDSAFYSVFMFYSNGIFMIATTSKLDSELISCFENGKKSKFANYPQWGIYKVINDTIHTQSVRVDERDCVFFRDYKILPNGQLLNISDYSQAKYSRLGFMVNYPSFQTNECPVPAIFYPTTTKRDSLECPFIGEKWFEKR